MFFKLAKLSFVSRQEDVTQEDLFGVKAVQLYWLGFYRSRGTTTVILYKRRFLSEATP